MILIEICPFNWNHLYQEEKNNLTVDIKNLVEKIVFDEDHLFELKEVLNQLNENKINLKEVKHVILNQKTDIMESIIDLFSFYLNQQQSRVSPNESGEKIEKLQLQVKERENLLEEIGKRIEIIANKSFTNEKNF